MSMDINKENVQKIIDVLKDRDNCFHMNNFTFHKHMKPAKGETKIGGCGTPACIAGWADSLKNSFQRRCEFFGIYTGEYFHRSKLSKLFYPPNTDFGINNDDITREDAIKTLEILRDTGEVDWSHVFEKHKKESKNV